MAALPSTAERKPVAFRIGEVAKLTDLTTRTLRYWEELGLVRPSSYGNTGERLYSRADVTRATRIRDLQKFLGFSLAEVHVVLDVEQVEILDRVKSELRSGDPSPERQRALIDEAIVANSSRASTRPWHTFGRSAPNAPPARNAFENVEALWSRAENSWASKTVDPWASKTAPLK
jgi:DNA-binding transcriptional MerR regulator